MKPAIFLWTLTALLATAAYAGEDGATRPDGRHHRPPKVAIEACDGAVQGDPCSFVGRRDETVEGTCEGPEDRPLACRPTNPPPRELEPES